MADAPVNPLNACAKEADCGGTKGVISFCQVTPEHAMQRHIQVENQFGTLFVDTIKPDRLLVPTAINLEQLVETPDNNSHSVDHYECYQVTITEGTPAFERREVLLADAFSETPRRFSIRAPTRLCNPVRKNGEEIKKPDDHLMCYTVSRIRGEPVSVQRTGVHTNHQFGLGQLGTTREKNSVCRRQKLRSSGAQV